jgi:hypothetical protein
MVKRQGPPSQGWRTFLRNHAPDIAAIDLLVVPTIGFDMLYAFVIVRIGLCTRKRGFLVRFIRPESFVHNPSSAGFIITTSVFEFSVHIGH